MGVLRIPEEIYAKASAHVLRGPGERFAFFHARVDRAGADTVFAVQGVTLVPSDRVRLGRAGYDIDSSFLLDLVNDAVRGGYALVEAHNHKGALPRFSKLDLEQLGEFVPYVLESLGGRPYSATVWGDDSIYGVYYSEPDRARPLRSICAVGERLLQVVSRDDDLAVVSTGFDRQLPWFTAVGQRRLSRLRVAVVGAGGTASPLVLELAYLGLRDLSVIDYDDSDDTSMNRLMTAAAADIGMPKALLARRAVLAIAPAAGARALRCDVRTRDALDALRGADVIFGCVDNDGARLVLNELAVAYGIPYFDLGVAIEADGGAVTEAGGRLAAVVPGGPCLLCMDLLDLREAAYFLASPEQQRLQRELGYVRGLDVPAPAVVSLNGTIASLAATELALYASGIRRPNPLTVVDVLGVGRLPGQWTVPERVTRRDGCVHCHTAGLGDRAGIERYAIDGPSALTGVARPHAA
jgi:molybdopterin/thiamine biosynthesis adenylyltransferase